MTHDPSGIGQQCAAETRLRRVGEVVSHPYGSSVAAEDLRGFEPVTYHVSIRVDFDELLPVSVRAFVTCGDDSVWCEFRLLRFVPHVATYSVSVSEDQA